MIELVGPGIGAHMRVDQKCLALLNARVTVLEIGLAIAQRLDLAPEQHQAGFIGFIDEIVVPRLPVDADDFFPGRTFS